MMIKPHEKGQAIVLIVLAIVGLVAITALAVDGGNVFADRRKAQSAVDNAALAAAREKVVQTSYDYAKIEAAANNIITANNLPYMVDSEVNYPPANGCDGNPTSLTGDSNFVQVLIRSDVDTYFGSVIGMNTLSHCVEAVAKARSSQLGSPFSGSAIVALECTDDKAFRAMGNSTLKVVGGGITVNSNQSVDASVTLGSIQLWTGYFNTAGGIKGTQNILNENGTGPADISQGMTQYTPCPVTLPVPEPTCKDANGAKINGSKDPTTNIITPGWITTQDLEGDAYLRPGVYCISGHKDAKLAGGDELVAIAGENGEPPGVLLYFTDAGLDLSGIGSANANLGLPLVVLYPYNYPGTPVDYPSWHNVLIYASHGNTSTFKWNGNSDSYFEGSILIPRGNFELLGTGNTATGMHSQIIANTILWSGTGDGLIIYEEDQQFEVTIAPAVELVH